MGLINSDEQTPKILTEDERILEKQNNLFMGLGGIEYIDNQYKGLEDFILVRLTDNPPTNNKMQTPKEAGAKDNDSIIINGQKYDYEYDFVRRSIHFTLNGEVSPHMLRALNTEKYAILIPFTDIKSRIVSAAPQDTFTYGEGVDIPKSGFLLCPQPEMEEMQKQNPNIQIVGYEGDKGVRGFANAMIQKLGYHLEDITDRNWYNNKSQEQFQDIAEKENLNFGSHYFSKYYTEDNKHKSLSIAIAIYKLVKDNELIKNSEDIPNINKGIEDARNNLEQYINGDSGKISSLDEIYKKLEEAEMPLDNECKLFLNDIVSAKEKGLDMDEELKSICKKNKNYLNEDRNSNESNDIVSVVKRFVSNQDRKNIPQLLTDIIQLQTLKGIERTRSTLNNENPQSIIDEETLSAIDETVTATDRKQAMDQVVLAKNEMEHPTAKIEEEVK